MLAIRTAAAVPIRQFVGYNDAGTIVNPVLLEGQVHGGYAQGIAQALFEEMRYDEHGNPLTSNFGDYAIPAAYELPSYQYLPSETPTDRNLLGAKGISEAGTIGATPAVWNAVNDALSHLGDHAHRHARHAAEGVGSDPDEFWLTRGRAGELRGTSRREVETGVDTRPPRTNSGIERLVRLRTPVIQR